MSPDRDHARRSASKHFGEISQRGVELMDSAMAIARDREDAVGDGERDESVDDHGQRFGVHFYPAPTAMRTPMANTPIEPDQQRVVSEL